MKLLRLEFKKKKMVLIPIVLNFVESLSLNQWKGGVVWLIESQKWVLLLQTTEQLADHNKQSTSLYCRQSTGRQAFISLSFSPYRESGHATDTNFFFFFITFERIELLIFFLYISQNLKMKYLHRNRERMKSKLIPEAKRGIKNNPRGPFPTRGPKHFVDNKGNTNINF